MFKTFCKAVFLTAMLLACCLDSRTQCVDSSEVNGFKVRSIYFHSLFGAAPKDLRKRLASHRGEAYSADRASQYIHEIRDFFSSDPEQQKYEELIANKLRFSVKAGRTWLECVEKIDPSECQRDMGTAQCVDVKIKRYFVDVDALDSSPYLLLFPRSALATLYGAIPRPLLALNPSFDVNQATRFGPSVGIDTATDLLDLKKIFSSEPPETQAAAVAPAQPTPTSDDQLVIVTTPTSSGTNASEEPPVQIEDRDTKLLLRLKGRKSLSRKFYDTSTGLTFARTTPLRVVQNVALETSFDAKNVPQGQGDFRRNAVVAGLSADLRLTRGPIRLLNIGAAYRWSNNHFTNTVSTLNDVTNENGFKARAIVDGTLANGLLRGAVWFDGGELNGNRGSYTRLATRVGYGKDIVIPHKKQLHKIAPPELGGRECWTTYASDPKTNDQTIGVEMLFGAGREWGQTPEYARFFGGSQPGEFLYDELGAETVTSFPSGPLLRSQGFNQIGAATTPAGNVLGGTSFWHANLNVSIPIAKWSRPLIPHEWVTASAVRDDDVDFKGKVPEGEAVCRDLKSTVKTLVGISGVNLMVNQQARDQLSDAQKKDLRLRGSDNLTNEEQARLAAAEQALTEAKNRVRPQVEEIFAREIIPVTNFIADHANMIAIKPLLMFDVAKIDLRSETDHGVRYAAGGGVQIDIVLARFEVGYIAALNRQPGDRSGNAIARLILKRFF